MDSQGKNLRALLGLKEPCTGVDNDGDHLHGVSVGVCGGKSVRLASVRVVQLL